MPSVTFEGYCSWQTQTCWFIKVINLLELDSVLKNLLFIVYVFNCRGLEENQISVSLVSFRLEAGRENLKNLDCQWKFLVGWIEICLYLKLTNTSWMINKSQMVCYILEIKQWKKNPVAYFSENEGKNGNYNIKYPLLL